MAAVTAGADAILAFSLDVGPEIPDAAWGAAQGTLASDIVHPREIATGDPEAVSAILDCQERVQAAIRANPQVEILVAGSETTLAGIIAPSGSGISPPMALGVASLTVLAAQAELFSTLFSASEITDELVESSDFVRRMELAHALFGESPAWKRAKAALEAKKCISGAIRKRLNLAALRWERLRDALDGQLMHWPRMRAMLAAAGVPDTPEALGLSPQRIAAATLAVPLLSNRYGIFDLALETGRLEKCAAAVLHKWQNAT
jgi:hypothetical protein